MRDPALHALLREVLVECPRCAGQALVVYGDIVRMTCLRCGRSEDAGRDGVRLTWQSARQDGLEPAFGLRLWLVTTCCGGNVLWAFNELHLDYLERFVASADRDRDFPAPPGNRGLAFKLPKWMQLAGNRAELLRSIDDLRSKVS